MVVGAAEGWAFISLCAFSFHFNDTLSRSSEMWLKKTLLLYKFQFAVQEGIVEVSDLFSFCFVWVTVLTAVLHVVSHDCTYNGNADKNIILIQS